MSAERRTMLLADWQDECDRRGRMDCKFVCPACGNEASPADFKAAGADPQRATQECIGRVAPEKLAADERGECCDWAAFGLLDICTMHVDVGEKLIPVFAFADVAEVVVVVEVGASVSAVEAEEVRR